MRSEDKREMPLDTYLPTKFRYLLMDRVLSGNYKIFCRVGKRVLAELLKISRNGYTN
jgi:hypothetical protein